MKKSKTAYMVFSNTKSHPTYGIKSGGCKINEVKSSKYLGIIIDFDLSLWHHIGHVLQKISASLGVLRRLSFFEEVFKYFIRIKFYQYHRLQRNIFFNAYINVLRCCYHYQTRFSTAGNLNVP